MDFLASFLLVVYVSNWSGKSADHSNAVMIDCWIHPHQPYKTIASSQTAIHQNIFSTNPFIYFFIYLLLVNLLMQRLRKRLMLTSILAGHK